MVNVAQYPITVDGVRLDTLAYGVIEHVLAVPGSIATDLRLPGADGVAASVWDDAEPVPYGLTILVRSSDDDGNNSTLERLGQNLDEIVHLFRGSPHRLKDLRRQVRSSGTTEKRAMVKVVDVIPIQDNNAGTAEVRVSCLIPGAYWEDPNTADWSQGAVVSGTDYPVTTLAGATAPIHDAVFLVAGPVQNPTITDPYTGASVTLGVTLGVGDRWRLNTGTWSSRTATTLTLASADTDGVDRAGLTTFQGGSSRYLSLVPERTARDTRRVRLRLTGSSMAVETALSVRARRKFLA